MDSDTMFLEALQPYKKALLMEFVLFIKHNQGLRTPSLDIEWVNAFLGKE